MNCFEVGGSNGAVRRLSYAECLTAKADIHVCGDVLGVRPKVAIVTVRRICVVTEFPAGPGLTQVGYKAEYEATKEELRRVLGVPHA